MGNHNRAERWTPNERWATPLNFGAADQWIETSLHNWLHNDLVFAPNFAYLHHHHAAGVSDKRLFILEDWAWIWHAHEQFDDQPHDHEGWDWSWHEHGLPELS